MTQTIVLGTNKTETKLKSIEFTKVISATSGITRAESAPGRYNYIELIKRGNFPGSDFMFAYNDPKLRENGIMYLGSFNDGIV